MNHLEIPEYFAIMETHSYLWTNYWEGIVREDNGKKESLRHHLWVERISSIRTYMCICMFGMENTFFSVTPFLVLVSCKEFPRNKVGILLDYDLRTILFCDALKDCPLLGQFCH